MMDMIERVAEAIWSAHTGATDFHEDTYRHDEKEREWWRSVARAAIEAMRENLLLEMRKEALAYGNNDPEKIGFEYAIEKIDAALSPNQNGG